MTNLQIAGRMLQFWGWIQVSLVICMLLTAWIASYSKRSAPLELNESLYFITAALSLLTITGVLAIVAGRLLKYQKLWCKLATLIISIISIFIFPIGTFFSVFIIMYLYRGWNDEAY